MVELCCPSGNDHSLKALCIINSENIWSVSQKMGLIFYMLHTTQVSLVSQTSFHINKNILKRYAPKQWWANYGPRAKSDPTNLFNTLNGEK